MKFIIARAALGFVLDLLIYVIYSLAFQTDRSLHGSNI
jgi:hypothetical protein